MSEDHAQSLRDINQHIAHWCTKNDLGLDCGVAGNFNSEIALIGNYVHEREKVMRMPFMGTLGETIGNALKLEKIEKSQCYQTIAVKRNVPLDKNNKPVATKEEVALYAALLQWELRQLPNLKQIVILGDYALKALFPQMPSCMECQGSVYKYNIRNIANDSEREVDVIVFIDPDVVNRQPKYRSTLGFNCAKLNRLIQGTFSEPIIQTFYNQNVEFVIKYIRKLITDKLPVALDIEVFNMETACIGLTNKVDEALCINFRDEFGNRYSVQDELLIRKTLQIWFNRTDEYRAKLVMQNGMFDSYWLAYKDRMALPPSYFDTMLASHTLASMLPHSLAYLTARYTDMSYYKDEGKTWKQVSDWPAFWGYNGKDCCATLQVHYKQLEELKEEKLDKFFFEHVMRLQPELIKMTVGGVLADKELKAKLAVDIKQDIETLKMKFYSYVAELTGDAEYKPNLSSPKQLAELYFTRLRLAGRGFATDAKNRTRMMNNPKTSETARKLLLTHNEWAKEQKFFSTYVNMGIDEDGRIRCEYKQTGVVNAPGRLSSSQTMWDSGANLQNQPPRAQELFIADDGYEFSYFDLSQAEARVVGWRYNIKQWIDDFERARIQGGFDAHRSLAAVMYKIPYDDVPKEDLDEDGNFTIRYKSKRCLPAQVNVLTKRGWVSIAEAAETKEAIAIWNKRFEIDWEVPMGWYSEYTQENLVEFNGEFTNFIATKDHRMHMINNGKFSERLAYEFLDTKYGAMPTQGILDEGEDNIYDRLWAATWSDGHLEANYPNSIRITVAKERKAERLRDILSKLNLKVWENESGGMYHFRIYDFREKALSWDMLNWSLKSRITFLDELSHWDGCHKTKRIFNTKLKDMRIIQALCHISGKRGTIFNHGVPRENEQQCYLIRPTNNDRTYYTSMNVKEVAYTGKVYCPSVSTESFLVQYNDTVSVSMNCRHGLNYTMMGPLLAEQINVDVQEGNYLYDLYHRTNPELKVGWDWTYRQLAKTNKMYNAYGRLYRNLDRIDPANLGNIVAFYFQSTIGDKVSKVIYQCHSDPEWPRDNKGKLAARMSLNIHDALIAINKIEDGDRVRRIMKKYAEEPIMIECIDNQVRELIIPADLKKSVGFRKRVVNNETIIVPDKHRWANLEKVKLVA